MHANAPALAPADASLEDLARRASAGDSVAFEALYRAQVGRIYGLCLRMSGDPRAAEELTQGVFVRAWEQLGSFRGDSAFSTWLHRLAVNFVLNDRRSTLRRLARVVSNLGSRLEEPAPRRSVSAGLDLERAIAALPTRARHVFVLSDIEGYQHSEIAALLGTTEGTSKAQLHRARALLREALT